MLRDASGNDFAKWIQYLSVNTRHLLDELVECEEIVAFIEDDDDDAMNKKEEFRMKCHLFSLKNVQKVIAECIETKCMNERHVEQLKVIRNRIERAINELKYV